MSEKVTPKRHIAADPVATWKRMEHMVRKAVTTPRDTVEQSVAREQASKPKRKQG